MCTGPNAKVVLMVLNGLFVLCGATLMGIGIWMKVDPMFGHYLHVVDIAASNSLIDWAAWIFIVIGFMAFFIAGVGWCGAFHESQCLIFLYIVMLFVLIAGEVIGGTLAIVYRVEVEAHLEKEMRAQLQNDYSTEDKKTYDAWNFLQVELECCGATNYTDYVDSVWWYDQRNHTAANHTALYVPKQCCKLEGGDYLKPKPENNQHCQDDAMNQVTSSHHLYTDGCHDSLKAWFQQHSLLMMCLGFGIAAVQLLGFVAACCLRRFMRTDSYSSSSAARGYHA